MVVRYKEAVAAYEAARDYDNAVRLYLDKLNDPENAVRIVKLTKRWTNLAFLIEYGLILKMKC